MAIIYLITKWRIAKIITLAMIIHRLILMPLDVFSFKSLIASLILSVAPWMKVLISPVALIIVWQVLLKLVIPKLIASALPSIEENPDFKSWIMESTSFMIERTELLIDSTLDLISLSILSCSSWDSFRSWEIFVRDSFMDWISYSWLFILLTEMW